MRLDPQPLNRPPPPLVARIIAKRYIREFMVEYEWRRTSCELENRDDGVVIFHDLVDDALVMEAVCSRAFRGCCSSPDGIMEEDILEALKREAGMLDAVPSAIEFKTTIKDITRMKPAMTVA